MSFEGLTIPKKATITKAYIQFVPSLTQDAPLQVKISAEANTNSPSFAYNIMEMSVRQKTAASVTGEMAEELILDGADIVKVGIGPGSPQLRTAAASAAIRRADFVVGYRPYLELIAVDPEGTAQRPRWFGLDGTVLPAGQTGAKAGPGVLLESKPVSYSWFPAQAGPLHILPLSIKSQQCQIVEYMISLSCAGIRGEEDFRCR